MPRALRFFLYGLAALAFALIGIAAYFAATFDAKRYIPRLVDLVRDKTGRTLAVPGDVKLSLWPNLGIETGPLTLSERDGQATFARVDSARLSVDLKPLLSRDVTIHGIDLRGAELRIVRDRQGRLNIADLLGREGPPAAFDIGHVNIVSSRITYEDLASGDRYTVGDIDAETGRLTKLVPTTVNARFSVHKADAPWRIAAALKSELVLDPDNERTRLHQAGLTGEAVLSAETVRFAFTVGAATHAQGNVTLEQVKAEAAMQGGAGTTTFKLAAPRFDREGDAFRAASVAFELDLVRGGTVTRSGATAALEGDFKSGRLKLDQLDGRVTAEGERLPNGKVSATARGTASVDLAKHGVQLALQGAIGESRVAADIAAAGFASPVYTFRVKVDKLNLDRYSTKRGPRDDKPESLLQPLADLPATGTLHIGTLSSGDTQMNNVTLVLK